jgi:GH15 family glucan-1,4-alpha-glucosidase
MLILRGDRLPTAADGRHVDEFDVTAGETYTFTTTCLRSHRPIPRHLDAGHQIDETLRRSEDWAATCTYTGPYADAVLRSLLVLRLLTHGSTGGIVAAPTTSLPEAFGGNRNWDYRYCWLRDASLTLSSLLLAGYVEEAELWRAWLLRAIAGDPQDLQILYGVDGSRDIPERELDHLPGYADSRPVRIGNGAVNQVQTDVLGEVMAALGQARDHDGGDAESWSLQRVLIGELAKTWHRRDHGLWEIRGPERHFTHSRLMVWVAFDEMVRAVETHGFEGPVDEWKRIRTQVREEILSAGFDSEHNTFVQHAETTDVDAALLLISAVGFLPGDDPRMLGTIDAVERDLLHGGLVMRYRTETGVDGLEGDEHPFLACSFWLVAAYARAGRVADARALMDRLVGLANDVGLLSEEYDPIRERMVGNFPQAFSHLALVQAAFALQAVDAAT